MSAQASRYWKPRGMQFTLQQFSAKLAVKAGMEDLLQSSLNGAVALFWPLYQPFPPSNLSRVARSHRQSLGVVGGGDLDSDRTRD